MSRNKYYAQKKTADGYKFDSLKEERRYQQLKLLERAGEISNLEVHPVFKFSVGGRPVLIKSDGYPNGRQAKYSGDFGYFDTRKGVRIVEDVKSSATKTEAYKLRRAFVEALFPGTTITEV
jgi:hypothetical protein